MSTTSRTRRTAFAVAWLAAGAIGATTVTGIAVATQNPTPAGPVSASASTGDATAAAGDRVKGMLRRVLHGELTIAGADGPTTVNLQRGKVTASSATSLTVRSTDGFTTTYAVGASTTVRRDRQSVTADKIAVGDLAFVRADGTTASSVRALSAEAAARLAQRATTG